MRRAVQIGDGWYPTPNNYSRPMRTLGQVNAAIAEFRALLASASKPFAEVLVGLGDVRPRWTEPLKSKILFHGTPKKIRDDITKCESIGIKYLGLNISGSSVEGTIQNMKQFAEWVR